MQRRPIIVGVDGSDPGYAAVTWAAREAAHRRAPLRIVHVMDGHTAAPAGHDDRSHVEAAWSESNALVDEATRRAANAAPDVSVRADSLLGRPLERLWELAGRAELMVVGYRGRGGFAGMRLGSVGERVARRAPCPVAVVRGHPAVRGPVVAGIDDSPVADAVLGTAFQSAADRACDLVVIHAAAEKARVEEQTAPWRPKYPRVPVEVRLTRADPGPALEQASAGAQLVVVGSRGRDYLRSVLLGSTGLHLLRHADCPVLIARPNEPREFHRTM
ncbi:universal stress protein [Paractinoplanes atraurantiacus]|uniref:Nucleotide-binding universal stress protein, UspA family n=1 Tax=Paractinoplanes atraurantiacus TaxID=1036182 RepID=A0A285JFT6_9ACTN|nr:universal stress protein [Actinoplanes atraurantiacus]SNY59159.1 Nucleotide-binding universal stress protein, UspA family [Actinoplanes atraurantiacus]